MDKLRMQTANKADENFKKLAAMFPNAVTETVNENGEVVRAIDKDVLMQEISCTVVDGTEERYAELQARRKIPMSMEDWSRRLDGFLEFNGEKLLTGPGKISAEQAKLHAETEYEKYRLVQDRLYQSDFDRFLMLEQEVNHKDEV